MEALLLSNICCHIPLLLHPAQPYINLKVPVQLDCLLYSREARSLMPVQWIYTNACACNCGAPKHAWNGLGLCAMKLMHASVAEPCLGVCDVERGYCVHAQLSRVCLGIVLGVVRPVEVLSRQRALAACHVPADDKVRAACSGSQAGR